MILKLRKGIKLKRTTDKILFAYSEFVYLSLRVIFRILLKKSGRDKWFIKNNYMWTTPVKGRLALVSNGSKFWCRTGTDDIDHVNSNYEEKSLGIFQPRPDDVVIDGGANIGRYTIHSAKLVGSNGTVFAFEPFHQTYNLLLKNISENNLKNVKPVQKALSNHEGIMKLYTTENYWGRNTLIESMDSKSVDIELTTIDSYVKDKITHLDWIKLDVERHECEVLEGAKETISKFSPNILVEVCFDNFTKTTELLASMGYGWKIVETSISFHNILAKRHQNE